MCPVQLRLLLWRLGGATFGWAGVSLRPAVRTLSSPPPRISPVVVVLQTQTARFSIMDNMTSSPAFPYSCTIKLDQSQYAFFQQSRLEIHSPEGKVLTVMKKPVPNKTDTDAVYQLWCQTCLLEVLFDEIVDRVKLPPKAINSIAHVVGRIDLHLKKQMRM
jgi:hypothetical protein